MKAFAIATITLGTLLLGSVASSAATPTKTCLTGTDPSVAADFAQISRVRELVDAACVCSSFDGSAGKAHRDYGRCAANIIKAQAAVPPGNLRLQCKRTVKRYYARSTCGQNPALNTQPCVKKRTATGAVSCTIKPTTTTDGFTPNDKCVSGTTVTAVSCPALTHCVDAADSNGDLRIGGGDSGACVDRPVTVHFPPSYVPGTPMPLVVMLHGYTASGALEESYLGLTALSDQRGFLYVHPDGTVDLFGNRFWNATEACCNLFGALVDDSAYLSGVIAAVVARHSVDPKRVYVVGHSNGGFMAYRMACDHADQIAAIVSLAGAMFDDPAECTPSSPVSVLQIHGTADGTIAYGGGAILGHHYPGAPTTVGDWVALDSCTNTPDGSLPPLDLDSSLPGAETTITQYADGCMAGSDVELWTIQGGQHVPALSPQFAPDLIDFLFAHPKP